MRRALALLLLEVHVEARYGVFAVAGAVAALWSLALLVLPPGTARAVAPLVVFADSATIGGFLLAALVLYERDEGALRALLVSPVAVWAYVSVKVAILTALAVLVAVPVAAAGGRLDVRPLPVVAGVTLTAALLLACCCALVARHRTLTAFLSVAPWALVPTMGLPLLALIGVAEAPAAALVPTVVGARLIAAGFERGAGVSALQIGYAVAAAGIAVPLAAARLRNALRKAGG